MSTEQAISASMRTSTKDDSNEVTQRYLLEVIRGIPQNPTFDSEKYEHLMDNFFLREDDVFVVTYVKAGTTWTQQIIHQLLMHCTTGATHASGLCSDQHQSYGHSVPWLEALTSEVLASREAPGWTLDTVNACPREQQRFFKSHANVEHLPGRDRGRGNAEGGSTCKAKVIYVARNPKDTAISLFHHARSKPEFGFSGYSLETFCRELFLPGLVENGSWFDHVIGWMKQCQAEPESHLLLRYEDMHSDPARAVRSIASFVGLFMNDATNEQEEEIIQRVVANSSIDAMKGLPGSDIGFGHLRRGEVGSWEAEMSQSPELSRAFDELLARRMAEEGLSFEQSAYTIH